MTYRIAGKEVSAEEMISLLKQRIKDLEVFQEVMQPHLEGQIKQDGEKIVAYEKIIAEFLEVSEEILNSVKWSGDITPGNLAPKMSKLGQVVAKVRKQL